MTETAPRASQGPDGAAIAGLAIGKLISLSRIAPANTAKASLAFTETELCDEH